MNKRFPLAAVLAAALAVPVSFLGACATKPSSGQSAAAQQREIDAAVDAALSRLYQTTAGSRELVEKSKGVLVVPGMVSAGLIVGGAHGLGALRSDGSTRGYYSSNAASVGLIVGAQSRDVFLVFMTQDALDRFVSGSGWTAGADASIAFVSTGVTGRIDTEVARSQVVGFALSKGGLIADASLEGTKFSKLAL